MWVGKKLKLDYEKHENLQNFVEFVNGGTSGLLYSLNSDDVRFGEGTNYSHFICHLI